MPPDYDQLPLPDNEEINSIVSGNKIKELVTTNQNVNIKSDNLNQSFEEKLLKKIKKN